MQCSAANCLLVQVEKVMQLHLACLQRIGVIIVGPSGSGKSTIWRLLQAALSSLGRPPLLHVLNPKAISRHHLLGGFRHAFCDSAYCMKQSYMEPLLCAASLPIAVTATLVNVTAFPRGQQHLRLLKCALKCQTYLRCAVSAAGHTDTDTREWTDGVLTAAARGVAKQPLEQRSWVVCDGDVDPEWIESLNSVLDDNRHGSRAHYLLHLTDLLPL